MAPNGKKPPKISYEFVHLISAVCMRFVFKIRQTVADIGIISQFHEFSNLIFGEFFAICPNCEP